MTILTLALSARAALVTKTVTYEQGGVKLESYLAYDDQTTALRPGVLVVPEWWGLNDYAKGRARQLAQLGYVALAVDMYGGGQATTDPKKAGELSSQFYGKPLMAAHAAGLRLDLRDEVRRRAVARDICHLLDDKVARALCLLWAKSKGWPAEPDRLIRPGARILSEPPPWLSCESEHRRR